MNAAAGPSTLPVTRSTPTPLPALVGEVADRAASDRGAVRPPLAGPFDAWLIDLDGTLYVQRWVRLAMAAELALCGPAQLRIIRAFRREHERLRGDDHAGAYACPYQRQLELASAALRLPQGQVAEVIHTWMEQRPGKWLRLFRRRRLLQEIAAFRAQGGRTALVSDYPARAKLAALDASLLFDAVVACGEPGGPSRLKPCPEGYLAAARRLGVEPQRCLVVGDRDDADGAAARRAGMSFRRIG